MQNNKVKPCYVLSPSTRLLAAASLFRAWLLWVGIHFKVQSDPRCQPACHNWLVHNSLQAAWFTSQTLTEPNISHNDDCTWHFGHTHQPYICQGKLTIHQSKLHFLLIFCSAFKDWLSCYGLPTNQSQTQVIFDLVIKPLYIFFFHQPLCNSRLTKSINSRITKSIQNTKDQPIPMFMNRMITARCWNPISFEHLGLQFVKEIRLGTKFYLTH